MVWRSITRRELAVLLRNAPQVSSSAVGETTIYRLDNNGLEILAMSLPDGEALIVEQTAPTVKRRRRVDATGVNANQQDGPLVKSSAASQTIASP